MSSSLKLIELPPSPNNMKARIALAYKNLEYERLPIRITGSPEDRKPVIEASGQPLTPVLLHGETVVYDSAAILRYLDANFRDTPPLFSGDYFTMKQIEDWERYGRVDIDKPVGMVFKAAFEKEPDPNVGIEASALMHEVTGRIERQLEKTPFLVGEELTAADVTAVPMVWYSMLPEEMEGASPIALFFAKHLQLGDGRDRTRAWVQKVMSYDPDFS